LLFFCIDGTDHQRTEITAITDLVTADEVPAANVVQCGWGENHSLEGAKLAAQVMLDKRDEWARVMKD